MKIPVQITALIILAGCMTTTDVTKTSKGFHEATNPNNVEILMTRPTRPYEELGAVTASGWSPSDTAKLHNALRSKAAPLGATAVVILNQGLSMNYWSGAMEMWATGVAIRYSGTPETPLDTAPQTETTPPAPLDETPHKNFH